MNRVEPNRNVYVGHRYVPLLVGEWDKSIQYEGLSIVTFKGNSYTSKKMTPPGIDIENEEYWVVTGNYDAQVEYYRQETERVSDDLSQAKIDLNKRIDDTVQNVNSNIEDLTIYVNDEVRKNKEHVDGELYNYKQDTDENIQKLNDELEYVSDEKTYTRVTNHIGSVVSFMFDDGQMADLTKGKPIADKYDIPISTAVITNYVGANENYMTWQQLKDVEADGWEILSHITSNVSLDTLTEEEIEYELRESKKVLEEQGFNPDSICYPRGHYDDRVMKITRKYYRAGLSSDWGVNSTPINTFRVKRYLIDAYDMETLKGIVDRMFREDIWVIFYTHPTTNPDYAPQLDKMDDLMAYIREKGVPVRTVNKALDMYENRLEIGDTDKGYFKVGADGTFETNPNLNYIFAGERSGIKVDTPITDFQKFKVTVATFNSNENSGFPLDDGAGTLTTYRLHNDDSLSFQTFESLNFHTAKRRWDANNDKWLDFEMDYVPQNQVTEDTPITDFPIGISHTVFTNANPFNGGVGVLKTHRVRNHPNMSYQEWNEQGENYAYRRRWVSSVWGQWLTPVTFKNNYGSADIGTVEAGSFKTVDVDIEGVKTTGAINVTMLSEVPDNIIYTTGVPENDIVRIKFYNLGDSGFDMGPRTIQVVQF